MTEERDDLVVLVDENGEETEFEFLDSIEMNGNEYVALIPYNGAEAEESDEEEIVILKVEHGEDGEDSFITIEDDEELEEVYEMFQSSYEDDFDTERYEEE